MKKEIILFILLLSTQIFANAQKIIWEGTGFQENDKSNWSIILTQEDDNSLTIQYPSLGCKGKWIVDSFDATHLYIKEEIESGKNCIQKSFVQVTILENDKRILSVLYRNIDNYDDVYAFAMLRKRYEKKELTELPIEELNELKKAIFIDSINKDFRDKIYEPFFAKRKIGFNCNMCEAIRMKFLVSIDSTGKQFGDIPVFEKMISCNKLKAPDIEMMIELFKNYYKSISYPKELYNQKIEIEIRPELLLKC